VEGLEFCNLLSAKCFGTIEISLKESGLGQTIDCQKGEKVVYLVSSDLLRLKLPLPSS